MSWTFTPSGNPRDTETFANILSEYKNLYGITGNVIYLWAGVYFCLSEQQPLPEWATQFIGAMAGNIWHLALQCAGPESGCDTSDPIDATMALKRFPYIAGMKADRQNAFARFVSDQQHITDASTVETLRTFGVPRKEINQRIAKRRGISDADSDRAVKRRVKKGKVLRWPNVPRG